ncbi:hypothetical protein [Paracoccus zhejiangensis]|nr:hypothetical protein [Paracoccus zhejiangensis]
MKAMYTAFLAIAVIGVVAAVALNSVGHSTAEAWQAGGGAVRLEGEPVSR